METYIMKTSENIQEIAKALSVAQGQIKPASKDAANPHFKSKFSSLAAIWDSIRDPLSSQGLVVLQDITTEDKSVISVTTRIIHTSGQWVEFGPMCIPISKNDAQGMGSASSYAKRYTLCAALGIVSSDDDDDGETAVGRGKTTPQPSKPKQEVSEFISDEELQIINNAIAKFDQESKNNFDKMIFDVYGCHSCKTLPKAAFDKCKASINNKLKYIEDQKKKAA